MKLMANYQVAWKASTRVATIQAKGDALPAGAVKIGEFKHDDAQDGLGASNINDNHVFYHHVRDALYKVGEQNMQTVSIEQDTTYVAVTGITRTSAASATVAVGGTYQFTQTIAPGGASNTKVLYTSSNPARATVNASGLVTGVATGAPATITATTEDGGFTATAAITVS